MLANLRLAKDQDDAYQVAQAVFRVAENGVHTSELEGH